MPERGAITLRSIILGMLMMPFNAIFLVLTEILWLTSAPTALSLFYNVVCVLIILIGINMLLKRWRPSWMLQPGELFVIYTMLSLASAICSIDMIDVLMPAMAHLHYFAPLEGRYQDIMEHVPEWLVVQDQTSLSAFYQGQESVFQSELVVPWIKPLAIWFVFIVALLAVMGGLALVFRRPWTQYEKLAYPVIQVPMMLVNETQTLLTSRLFWVGFIVIASINILNGFHFFYPAVPEISLVRVVNLQDFFTERPWNDMGHTAVSFFPFAIGLVFLMPVDLAFSCWFFFVFFRLQVVAASYYGFQGMPGFPYVSEQTAGGYYALAFLAIWITRRHLLRLVHLVLGKDVERMEPGERYEARLAATLILGGGLFLMGFSLFHGMNFGIALFFFMSYFLVAVAITRMRAELGYPSHDLHFIGPNMQIMRFYGASEMTRRFPVDLSMFGLYHFITRAYRSHPMPHMLEALRIAERNQMSQRKYSWAMALAVVVGTVAAMWGSLWVYLKYGASNITGTAEWLGREGWQLTDTWFTAGEPYYPHPTWAIIVGLVFSLFLATMRLNLTWWPFHPVGYAVSGSWSMEQLWMSFFVGWLIKILVMKYGGVKTYTTVIPLFMGMILADFTIGTFWTLFGAITEQDVYRFWPY